MPDVPDTFDAGDDTPPMDVPLDDGHSSEVPHDTLPSRDAEVSVPDVTPPMDMPTVPDVTPPMDMPTVPDVTPPMDMPTVPDVTPPMDMPTMPDACVGSSCEYDSCAELPPRSLSGVYTLRGPRGTWRGWCHVAEDGLPPWTLVMKVDGSQNTFQYDSMYWTTDTLLNPDRVNFDTIENAKYEGFNTIPVRQIRLRTYSRYGLRERTITPTDLPSPHRTLLELFRMPSPLVPTLNTLTAWQELYPNAQLQAPCQRFGLNVHPSMGSMFARVRIGGVGDSSDASCTTPNSWVGVGGFVNNPSCGTGNSPLSAGNVGGCHHMEIQPTSISTMILVR